MLDGFDSWFGFRETNEVLTVFCNLGEAQGTFLHFWLTIGALEAFHVDLGLSASNFK